MDAGVAALLGALVGGAITGVSTLGAEAWREWRGRRGTRKVAARLVREELSEVHAAMEFPDAVPDEVLRGLAGRPVWTTHRAVLARELRDDEWQVVKRAYDGLADARRGPEDWDRLRRAVAEARSTLARLAFTGERPPDRTK